MGLSGRVLPLDLRLPGALETAGGRYQRRVGWRLRLADSEGRVGWGEAMPLPAFGTEEGEVAGAALAACLPHLAEARLPDDPAGVEALVDRLPLGAWAPAARHALETALLDLLARRRGLPLAVLLGASPGVRVPVNALLAAQAPEALAREARAAVDAGYGTLKIKVGLGDPARDAARLAAVRAAVGTAPRLRVDANGAWGVDLALAALAALARYDLELCEQPVPAGDLAGLARVRADSPVPVAADEALGGPDGGRAVLAAGAADVLVLRPMTLGGLLPALALGRAAAALGVDHTVAGSLDGTAARAAAVHLAAALGGRRAAGLSVRLEGDPWPDTYPVEGGSVVVPDAPGTGLEDRP